MTDSVEWKCLHSFEDFPQEKAISNLSCIYRRHESGATSYHYDFTYEDSLDVQKSSLAHLRSR